MIVDEIDNEETSSLIRCQYRLLREQIQENRLEYTDPNSDAIEETFESVQQVYKGVKKPREAVSDSKVLLELAILGKERIKNVQCVFRQFNNAEYMDKLKMFMANFDKRGATQIKTRQESDEEEEIDVDEEMPTTSRASRGGGSKKTQKATVNDRYVLTKPILSAFGEKAMSYCRLPPRPTFMLGSLDKDLIVTHKKVRQQRRAADRDDVEAKRTKIRELDAESNENEANSTVSEIERVFKCLKRAYKKLNGNPICLYEFTVNPKSFSRTIENIFYVSFLIKDGYAKMYLDADELPVIEPVLENEPKSFAHDPGRKKREDMTNIQSMISLSQTEWKEIIEVFGIQSAIIPDPK